MINPFILKKVGALITASCVSTVFTMVGLLMFGLWVGIGLFIIGILLSLFIGNILLKNPFSEMLEGKGVLALDVPSTGVIRPFIVGISNPFLEGNLAGEKVRDVFDRATVYQMATPVKSRYKAQQITDRPEGGINIELTEDEYNNSRMALYTYPVILYNSMIKSIVTKDFLAAKENGSMILHILLQTNRSLQELTSLIRDFARYIIEQMRPKLGISGKWAAIIVFVLIAIILLAIFGPSILANFKGPASAAGSAISGAAGTIVPRG